MIHALMACFVFTSIGFAQTDLAVSTAPPVRVTVRPETPLIEHRGTQQLLNFDFVIENAKLTPLHLNRIRVSLWDRTGKLMFRREVDENGHPSGMTTIEPRDVPANGQLGVFNPFYSFGPDLKLEKMSYTFYFNDPGYKTASALDYQYSAEVNVTPRDYSGKTNLSLPLHGRMLIFDGHDFYAHHRRQNPTNPNFEKLGLRENSTRYAYDFCPVNKDGEMYHDSPYKKENWFGYGSAIYAPAAGTVVGMANDVAENEFDGKEVVYANIAGNDIYRELGGNYVVLDHANGEFSYFAHMKPGSVRVRVGDHVKDGDQIGNMGFAGDAFIPHLHYMLIDNADVMKAEGVPSYFHNFRRIMGANVEAVGLGQVDSGDIIESQKK